AIAMATRDYPISSASSPTHRAFTCRSWTAKITSSAEARSSSRRSSQRPLRCLRTEKEAVHSTEQADAELMRRAAAGEVDAFAEIYDRHAPALLALLRRMLGTGGEAQDLLHDVFLQAWESVREYDASRGSARTWLLVRARSRALDRLQRRSREQS